ncbi:YrzI family small protein [Metabacillus dongyingensis]|nr:YrzI family small protein [Metabacillus dongyingensis]UAL51120.1 YrzI family small protein [Metabacillus dongyingensis]UOK57099.1 YrzI family small protein [Bacillus sp. OVS6]USK27411.1 YrzI family small protein [Bacillus sp. CMF21]
MTIHLLFVTLTIKRKHKSIDQVQHEEQVFKSYEAMMNKCFQMYNGN